MASGQIVELIGYEARTQVRELPLVLEIDDGRQLHPLHVRRPKSAHVEADHGPHLRSLLEEDPAILASIADDECASHESSG